MAAKQIRRKRRQVSTHPGDGGTGGNLGDVSPVILVGDTTSDDDTPTRTVDGTGNKIEYDFIDPSTAYSGDPGTGTGTDPDSSTGTGRRRAYTKRTRKTDSETTKTLATLLYTIHLFGSSMVGAEELALTEDESSKLAEAMTKVSQLYDVPLMSEKTAAWIGLAFAAGSIYGPRVIAVRARHRTEDAEQKRKKVTAIN
jgi:hypothetical protein